MTLLSTILDAFTKQILSYVLSPSLEVEKDAEGHKVSDEIKEVLSYMNGNEPASDYTKMLDAAVKEIKQNDERRHEYMSRSAQLNDREEVGEYKK